MSPFLVTAVVVVGTYQFYNNLLLPFARTTDLLIQPALGAFAAQAQSVASQPADKALAAMTVATDQYTARIIWTGFVGVFLALLLAALATIAFVTYQVFRNESSGLARSRGAIRAVVIIMLAVATYVVAEIDYSPIANPFLSPTLYANVLTVHLGYEQRLFDQIDQIFALLLAATIALALPSPGTRDAKCLRTRTELLKTVLTVGTILLVIDVIRGDALLRWGLTFVPNASAKAVLQELVTTITAERGLLGSILLASIYLPGAFIVRNQIGAAVPEDSQGSADAVQVWMKAQGLISDGPIAQLRPTLTLLLPFLTGILAGPASQVLKNLPHP